MSTGKVAIIIDDCMICPFVGKCKPWKKLTKKQRLSLKLSISVGKFILNGCPIPEMGSTEEAFNPEVI